MAISRRLEMERESILETMKIDGVVTIPKKRFIFLGNGKNMSKSVLRAWNDSWEGYNDETDDELILMETISGLIVLWTSNFIEGDGPSKISDLF